MRTRFKIHAALAGGLSAVMLTPAALTLLPGRLPLPSPGVINDIAGTAIIPLAIWTFVGAIQGIANRKRNRVDLRHLPRRVQLAVGTLIVAGIALTNIQMRTDSNLQSVDVREGHYYAREKPPDRRSGAGAEVEVSRQEYAELREADQRGFLTISGFMLAVMTLIGIASGEMERPARPLPHRTEAAG